MQKIDKPGDCCNLSSKERIVLMKALYVQTFCCEGIMDFIHGGGSYTDGIFVPEEDLMIRYTDKTAYVAEGELAEFTSSSPGGGSEQLKPRTLRDLEIPDSIVAAARAAISSRNAFTEQVRKLWETEGLK